MALCVALAGCSKPVKKMDALASASANATASTTEADAAVPNTSRNRAPIPLEALKAPPLLPPADALSGPGGVHVQMLRLGTGASPGDTDTILVDFSMWTSDGKLALSSYPGAEPVAFSVASLPVSLRSVLTQLKVGGQARLWAPREALASWKPQGWPDSDLIFELELLSVTQASTKDSNGNVVQPEPFQPPDAAGAPPAALKTASGLRYLRLEHAAVVALPKRDDRLQLEIAAYVVDGIEIKLLKAGIKSATTLQRAPGKLGEVLSQLSSGDRVRIWLPKGQAQPIIPEAGARETILDLDISFVH